VLNQIQNGFYFDQGSSGDVRKPSEFLRPTSTDAFSQVQCDAITSTTPLIREIPFGIRKSIDKGSRQHGQPSRVLVRLQVFEKHVGNYSVEGTHHHQTNAASGFFSPLSPGNRCCVCCVCCVF